LELGNWEIFHPIYISILSEQFQNFPIPKFQNSFMSLGEEQLKRIQEKLQQVLKQQSSLQKENQTLKEELNNSRKEMLQHHENIDKLKQQVEVLKLGSGEMNAVEKKQLEKRINAYVKEIDRCIAMLGS
jgi:predicted  nucleic acid-binding Zn-ribbon protein